MADFRRKKSQRFIRQVACLREVHGTDRAPFIFKNAKDAEIAPMKVKPLQDRVIVKRLESEEKTKSGIIIPDNAKEKPMEAEVVAVGNGKLLDNGTLVKPSVKEGDRVLIGKYSGSEIKIGGVEHVILKEDEIYGVIL
jgi:chaperonin GroES